MVVHSFDARARAADTPAVRRRAEAELRERIEASHFRWTERGGLDDKRGVDVWAELPSGQDSGVEVKDNRWGEVRVEYVSRVREGIVGWTVNDRLISDYVLYLWPRRAWLIDYPQLRRVAKAQRERYMRHWGQRPAESKGLDGARWQTEFAAVPVGILLADIFGTTVMGAPLSAERICPACHESHPAGTTCAEGWAPWR
jgi:hypothetical protein